jgi:type II secretory ATPase GspE/PulE/Tfp pilus assembly ATPase PilB-like protein
LCPHCKIKIRPNEKVKNYITEKVKGMPASEKSKIKIEDPLLIYAAKGCELCGFTGYSGRTGLYEVFSMSDDLAEVIQKSPLENLIFKAVQKQGMLTMGQEGVIKILQGETSIEEVTRATGEE